MQQEDGPGRIAGDTFAITEHQEDEPAGTAGDLPARATHQEDPPEHTAGEPLADTEQEEGQPAAGEPLVDTEQQEGQPATGGPLVDTEQQTAQQPQTLATHIQEHENIEVVAQDRADAVIERIRRQTDSAYHFAFDKAIREIRSDQNRNFDRKLEETIEQFRQTLEGLTRQHTNGLQDLESAARENQDRHDRQMDLLQSEIDRNRQEAEQHQEELVKAHIQKLTTAAEDSKKESAEQLRQYTQICSETAVNLTERLDEAIKKNSGMIDSKLREHRTAVGREQRQKTEEAIAAAEAKWKKRSAALLVVALTASAIAAAALVTAIL